MTIAGRLVHTCDKNYKRKRKSQIRRKTFDKIKKIKAKINSKYNCRIESVKCEVRPLLKGSVLRKKIRREHQDKMTSNTIKGFMDNRGITTIRQIIKQKIRALQLATVHRSIRGEHLSNLPKLIRRLTHKQNSIENKIR